MNNSELKEKIENRIDHYIDVHIESMHENIAEVTTRMNDLNAAVSFINYLITLKERAYKEILKN